VRGWLLWLAPFREAQAEGLMGVARFIKARGIPLQRALALEEGAGHAAKTKAGAALAALGSVPASAACG
jgi:hypothetical protein